MLIITVLLACGANEAVTGVFHHDASASSAFLAEHVDAVVVDVRTSGEFAGGHLAGAKNIDFRSPDFAQRIAELPKDRPILLHCQSGGRSRAALKAFQDAGFEDVHHLDGGYGAWEAAGLPVDR